jgi:hypothetical protein
MYAGNEITSGTYNTIMGHNSSASGATAVNQTVVGASAIGQADNSVTLGDDNVTAIYMSEDKGATVYTAGISLANDETITNSTDGTVLINGTVAGGTGSAAGVFQSNGDYDVTLQTGNSTTGSITITDGANGNIALAPNGSGAVQLDGLSWPTADGSANQILATNGGGALSWATQSSTVVTITDNESTNEGNALVFAADADLDGGTLGLESDGDATYNPSTGVITATGFSGATVVASTSVDVSGSAGVILQNDETITNSTDGTVLINGTVAGGTGSAAGVFQSNGDYDVTLQTGNSTTGSITITDGANGDITVAPNGTGETTFGGNPISNYSASTASITGATTLAASHNGKVLICNSSSDFSLTIPEDTLPAGFNVMIVQKGAGEITLAAASGNVTINNRNSHTKTANTWAIMSLICIDATTDANVFVSGGDGAS